MVVLLCKKLSVLGNIPFHKGNECAFHGNSKQDLSQLITPIELCMSSKLFYKVSFTYIKTNPYL